MVRDSQQMGFQERENPQQIALSGSPALPASPRIDSPMAGGFQTFPQGMITVHDVELPWEHLSLYCPSMWRNRMGWKVAVISLGFPISLICHSIKCSFDQLIFGQ